MQFAHSANINSVFPLRVSSDAHHAASLVFSWRSILNFATAGPLAGGVRVVPP
jgi:hypothetical protein